MPVQTITKTASAVSTRTKIIATAVAVAALGGIAAGLLPLLTGHPDLQIGSITFAPRSGNPAVTGQPEGIETSVTVINKGDTDLPAIIPNTDVSSPNDAPKNLYLGIDLLDAAGTIVLANSNEIYFDPLRNPDFVLTDPGSRTIRFIQKNGLTVCPKTTAGTNTAPINCPAKKIIITLNPSLTLLKGVISVKATADPTLAVVENDDNNNNMTVEIPANFRNFKPDYQVTDFTITPSGTNYTFSLSYNNIGATYGQGWVGIILKDATGNRVLLNSDSVKFDGYSTDALYKSVEFAAISIPQDYVSTDPITLRGTINGLVTKSITGLAGAVSATAKVDIVDGYAELNEHNNEKTVSLTVIEQKPDLTVTAPLFSVNNAGEAEFTFSTSNIGNVAQKLPYYLLFSSRKGDNITLTRGDIFLLSGSTRVALTTPSSNKFDPQPTTGDVPGQKYNYRAVLTKQLLNKGITELWLNIDSDNQIDELSETNNTSFAALPSSVIVKPLPAPADPSMVSFWKFDEGVSGTTSLTVKNEISTSLNATFNTTPVWSEGYMPGSGAANLSQTPSRYAKLARQSALQPLNGLTIDLWFKPTSFPSTGTIIDNSIPGVVGNRGGYVMTYGATGKVSLEILRGDTATSSVVTSSTPLTLNAWNHITATYSPTARELKMFVNGALSGTTSNSILLNYGWKSVYPFTIGVAYNLDRRWAIGAIDNLAIYNRTLSNTEVLTLHGTTPTATTAPSVTMQAPTNITPTTATWNAAVNPNGAVTTGWFRHTSLPITKCTDLEGWRIPGGAVDSSITTGYNLGSGTTETKLYGAAGGLKPGTTYRVCAYANNAGGKSFSSVYEITMPAPATLTVVRSNTSPSGTLVPSQNTELLRFNLTSKSEQEIKVSSLTFSIDNECAYDSAVAAYGSSFSLVDATTNGGTSGGLTFQRQETTIDPSSMVIPAGTTKTYKLIVDTTGCSQSGIALTASINALSANAGGTTVLIDKVPLIGYPLVKQ